MQSPACEVLESSSYIIFSDPAATSANKPLVSEGVHTNAYHIRTEPVQGNLYSPEQTSLHESEGLLFAFSILQYIYFSINCIKIQYSYERNKEQSSEILYFPTVMQFLYSYAGFISPGSVGNSRSSTQMNSYSDSGYQEVSSFHNSQNLNKPESRQQHSRIGTATNHLVRSSRAEGQTLVQVCSK